MRQVGGGNIARAMLIMVVAMLLAPLMDGLAKILAVDFAMAPASITLARFSIQMALLFLVILFFSTRASLKSENTPINLLRGAIMGIASMLFFVSVKYMPLADAIAIFFTEPLILMLMSSVFLGERVGTRRKIAALIGFGGALLVIQPSYSLFGPVSLLPLLVAVLFSVYLILTRKFSTGDDPLTMQLYAGIGGSLILAIVVSFGTISSAENLRLTFPTEPTAIVLVLLIGLIATVTHLMIVFAFRLAEASILAPFQYVEIISATVFGYLMFSDFPDGMKAVGILIIIGSGLYTFMRERQLEKQAEEDGLQDGSEDGQQKPIASAVVDRPTLP